MRTAGEIRTELLKLRDLKRLPYSHMEEHSRCSRKQIVSALLLEATEDVLRRLDAYIDAKHLHVRKKSNELLWRIEQIDRELYRQWQAKTIHILTVQDWPQWKQERHLSAMDYRAKRLLHETLTAKGIKVRMPDGTNYWVWKAKLKKRGLPVDFTDGDAGRLLRQGPMGKSRFL